MQSYIFSHHHPMTHDAHLFLGGRRLPFMASYWPFWLLTNKHISPAYIQKVNKHALYISSLTPWAEEAALAGLPLSHKHKQTLCISFSFCFVKFHFIASLNERHISKQVETHSHLGRRSLPWPVCLYQLSHKHKQTYITSFSRLNYVLYISSQV